MESSKCDFNFFSDENVFFKKIWLPAFTGHGREKRKEVHRYFSLPFQSRSVLKLKDTHRLVL